MSEDQRNEQLAGQAGRAAARKSSPPAPAAEPAAGVQGAEPGGGGASAGPDVAPAARPWHADPWFMAGVGVSILLALAVAVKPWGCKSCKDKARMAAELGGAVDLPEPAVRTAAQPPQQPGPGVSAPSTEEAHAQLDEQLRAEGAAIRGESVTAAPPPTVTAPPLPTLTQPGAAGPGGNGVAVSHAFNVGGPKCTEVEWCALSAGHAPPHMAPARQPLTPAELAAAAAGVE